MFRLSPSPYFLCYRYSTLPGTQGLVTQKPFCLQFFVAMNKCSYKKEKVKLYIAIVLIVSALLCPILDTSSLSPALMSRNILLGLHGGPWASIVLEKSSSSPNRRRMISIYRQVDSIQITFPLLNLSTSPPRKDLYYLYFLYMRKLRVLKVNV